MANNFLQYLDSIKFFSPSEELAGKLSLRIDNEIFNDLKQAKADSEDPGSSVDDLEDLHNENSEQWLEQEVFIIEEDFDLVEVNFLASRDYRQQRGSYQIPEMSIEMPKTDSAKLRRFVSEQIYQLLASAAREEEAKKGAKLSIPKIFNEEEFPEVLGLPDDEPLLNDLINEFNLWITNLGECSTDWGKILHCEGDNIYLSSYYDW